MTLLLGTVVPADGSGFALLATVREQQPRSNGAVQLEARTTSSQTDARVPERLRKVFVEDLMVEASRITYDARFVEDLGFDSLKTVNCVGALEERFGIELPDEEAEKFLRVRDVVEYLRRRKLID
jgi:acyl carrier protein